jgi:hypothetical protein
MGIPAELAFMRCNAATESLVRMSNQYGMSQLEGKQRYGDPRGPRRCEFVPEYRGSIRRRFCANGKFSTALPLSPAVSI